MAEDKSIQELGLFHIPLGDKKWFAEHTGHRHHHHHHHKNETTESKAKESEPVAKEMK